MKHRTKNVSVTSDGRMWFRIPKGWTESLFIAKREGTEFTEEDERLMKQYPLKLFKVKQWDEKWFN